MATLVNCEWMLRRIHRNYHRALNELQRLEDAVTADQPLETPAPPPGPPVITPPEPAPAQSNQQPIPNIGFVPQIMVGQAVPPANPELAASPRQGPEALRSLIGSGKAPSSERRPLANSSLVAA